MLQKRRLKVYFCTDENDRTYKKHIKFTIVKDKFHCLKNDNSIRKWRITFVKADKILSYYKLSNDEYNKLLFKNIKQNYKINHYKWIDLINKQSLKISVKLKLENTN